MSPAVYIISPLKWFYYSEITFILSNVIFHRCSLDSFLFHYSYVIMSILASQITSDSTVCLSVCLDELKENIKACVTGLLWGESIGDRWIPLTKGQLRGNRFHVMTSSCEITHAVEILLHWGQGSLYPAYSLPGLLMAWRHKEPGHLQPWYWYSFLGIIRHRHQNG